MAPVHLYRSASSILSLGILLIVGGCGSRSPSPANAQVSTLASIVVQSVHAPLERMVDGTIEAVNQATVSAQTAGRITEILYDVNDVVPAGAVIIRLKGNEQRASLEGAQAAITEAKARNGEAVTTYQRISDLFQRHVVSKAQLDQATANRDAAAARLTAAEAALVTAREGVGYTEIRAPYGGVVTKRLVEVGGIRKSRNSLDDRAFAQGPEGRDEYSAKRRDAGTPAQTSGYLRWQ